MTSIATRTALLMAALIALLGIGGWAFGGSNGLTTMIVLGLAINVGSYWFSDRIALAAHRAVPVSRDEAPELYEIVERLAASARMPMPSIHVIPSGSPNAFATGRGPKHAAVAVTQGLLEIMDRRELAGVLAHELSHVKNRDPDGLADALERLDAGSRQLPYEHAGPATAHLFIVNPLHGRAILSWFSTHPPIEERVARLRSMRERGGPRGALRPPAGAGDDDPTSASATD